MGELPKFPDSPRIKPYRTASNGSGTVPSGEAATHSRKTAPYVSFPAAIETPRSGTTAFRYTTRRTRAAGAWAAPVTG